MDKKFENIVSHLETQLQNGSQDKILSTRAKPCIIQMHYLHYLCLKMHQKLFFLLILVDTVTSELGFIPPDFPSLNTPRTQTM